MVKKLLVMLFAVLVSSTGLVSSAIGATIHERVEIAQQRIEHGMRAGSLTRPEGRRLRDELIQVRQDEARARSDGHMLAAKGTAAPKPAAPPTAEVAKIRLRRVLLTFSLSLMKMPFL